MSKRYTDNNKWRDEWFGSLDNDYRMIWLYLVDNCSIAGIWKKDFRGLNFNCNTKITPEQFHEAFKSRVVDRGTFYFIPKYLQFQYPTGLNSNKPMILSVVRELEYFNLTTMVNQMFGNDYLSIKVKVKVKDKVKEELNKESISNFIFGDEMFVENLELMHKGKDFTDAFEQCYTYWTNAKNPPTESNEWKQKFAGWLQRYTPSTRATEHKPTFEELEKARKR